MILIHNDEFSPFTLLGDEMFITGTINDFCNIEPGTKGEP